MESHNPLRPGIVCVAKKAKQLPVPDASFADDVYALCNYNIVHIDVYELLDKLIDADAKFRATHGFLPRVLIVSEEARAALLYAESQMHINLPVFLAKHIASPELVMYDVRFY